MLARRKEDESIAEAALWGLTQENSFLDSTKILNVASHVLLNVEIDSVERKVNEYAVKVRHGNRKEMLPKRVLVLVLDGACRQ